MKVIKYKVFQGNEDFVEWQKAGGVEKFITSITPLVAGLHMETSENKEYNKMDHEAKTNINLFVLYMEEE